MSINMRHAPSFQTFRSTASRPRSDDDGAVACLTLFWAVVLIMFQIFFHVLAPFFLLTSPKFSILGISLSFGAAIRAVSLFPPGGVLALGRFVPIEGQADADGETGNGGGTTGNRYRWDAGAGGSVEFPWFATERNQCQRNVGSWDCDRVWRSGWTEPGIGRA